MPGTSRRERTTAWLTPSSRSTTPATTGSKALDIYAELNLPEAAEVRARLRAIARGTPTGPRDAEPISGS